MLIGRRLMLLAGFWGACAVGVMPGLAREALNINGMWQVEPSEVQTAEFPVFSGEMLPVPSSWGRSGGNRFFEMPEQFSSDTTRALWYKKTFSVPEEWRSAERLKLKFHGVQEGHRIWVNGKLIAESPIVRLAQEYDIIDVVNREGENEVIVQTLFQKAERPYPFNEFGITRDVELLAMNDVSIRYVLIDTDVKSSTIRVRAIIRNDSDTPQTLPLNLRVFDVDGSVPLVFEEESVTIPAHGEAEAVLEKHWDSPRYWGYGPYGTPELYTLESSIGDDVRRDTFGFRTFRTEGSKFLLNEREFFIKGDLLSRTQCSIENFDAITAYYRRAMDCEVNLQRMHSHDMNNFDSPVWYEVADQCGMLVEAQLSCYHDVFSGAGRPRANDPSVKNIWSDYVREYYNHPSIVLWSVDNETFSVGLASRENLKKIKLETAHDYDELMDFVRTLDPGRIIEIHHNYMLYPLVRRGEFSQKNFTTFNIHPYGSLKRRINTESRGVGFRYEVPILVGEVFTFPNPRDFSGNPGGTYADQWRVAESFAEQIADAAAARGVGGIILCSLDDTGFIGFKSPDELALGPWSEQLVQQSDEGDGFTIAQAKVTVRNPAMGGSGFKAQHIPAYAFDHGNFGFNVNWFDWTVPPFRTNIVADKVREAFAAIGDKDTLFNGTFLQPLTLTVIGAKPNSAVRLQDVATGVSEYQLADDRGRVRFYPAGGSFSLSGVAANGQKVETTQTDSGEELLFARPLAAPTDALLDPAANKVVNFAALSGDTERAEAEQKQLELERTTPAELTVVDVRLPGELVANGSFREWAQPNHPAVWFPHPAEQGEVREDGSSSAIVHGSDTNLVQTISLMPGRRYRLTGKIRKLAGDRHGSLFVRSADYNILQRLDGSDVVGEWRDVELEFTATGKEFYLYCFNDYMGSEGACEYADLSLRAVDNTNDESADTAYEDVDHEVGPEGFFRKMLAIGPFPNYREEERIEFLGDDGNVRPKQGEKVTVNFSEECYWNPGERELKWKPITAGQDFFDLTGLKLPAAGISAPEPGHVAAYVFAWIDSPEERDGFLSIGSDDGNRVWFDGKFLGEVVTTRGLEPEQEVYPIHLRKGKNALLVKVLQNSGGWGVLLRILDSNQKPMTDLTTSWENSNE